eukprot:CAMPEP_0197001396 /NCGR_PEP_ID=MMETSP1380-20130617/6107_1 /TAXON_ID=5936 /ORGANISM="Euplotes crassus, Strain CT5" /LENGTH=140 /DNA_ID=CAMNT_0042419051 /DNA_START=298 /DNA_END=722 /DNA_ORIENTATION=+
MPEEKEVKLKKIEEDLHQKKQSEAFLEKRQLKFNAKADQIEQNYQQLVQDYKDTNNNSQILDLNSGIEEVNRLKGTGNKEDFKYELDLKEYSAKLENVENDIKQTEVELQKYKTQDVDFDDVVGHIDKEFWENASDDSFN